MMKFWVVIIVYCVMVRETNFSKSILPNSIWAVYSSDTTYYKQSCFVTPKFLNSPPYLTWASCVSFSKA